MLTGDVEGPRDDGLPVQLIAWFRVPGGLPVLTPRTALFGGVW